jgi:hypothetical protein
MKIFKMCVFALVALVILALVLTIPVMGASVEKNGAELALFPAGVPTATGFFDFLNAFLAALPMQLLALLVLISANLILAVAVAIKNKKFEWKKFADFYIRQVIPYILGWGAFGVVAHFSIQTVLGPEYGVIASDTVTWAAWLIVVGALGAKIVENAKALYGKIPFEIQAGPQ